MPLKITKAMVIIAIQQEYTETGEPPKSTTFIFSRNLVAKRFGSWNAALQAAGVPLRRNKPIIMNCQQCNASMSKSMSQVKRTHNHFCSHECSAIYSNQRRYISDAQRENHRFAAKQRYDARFHTKPCMVCQKIFTHKKRKTCSDRCRMRCSSKRENKHDISYIINY